MLTKSIIHSFFVRRFYFSIFYNIFFNNQIAFVIHLLGDFYIVRSRILAFHVPLYQKDIDTHYKLVLKPFFNLFDNI